MFFKKTINKTPYVIDANKKRVNVTCTKNNSKSTYTRKGNVMTENGNCYGGGQLSLRALISRFI